MDLSLVVSKLKELIGSGMLERSVSKAVEEALWCVEDDIAHEADPKEVPFEFLKDHIGEHFWFVNRETNLRGAGTVREINGEFVTVKDSFTGASYILRGNNGWKAYELDDIYLCC